MAVDSPGLVKVSTLAEGFPTFMTLTGLLSRVLIKMHSLAEGFSTDAAFIRSLSTVKSVMLSERCDAAESFDTLTTLVGLLPRVDSQVLGKG